MDYRIDNNNLFPKFAISISSKLAKANVRNKFKRQIREIFRLNQHKLKNNIEICFKAKKISEDLKYKDLEKDFFTLLPLMQK